MLKVGDIIRREIYRSGNISEFTYGEVKKIKWFFWAIVEFDDLGCACYDGKYCKVNRWYGSNNEYEKVLW